MGDMGDMFREMRAEKKAEAEAKPKKVVRFEIPPGTPIGTCRSCGAAIAWVKMKSGKMMPLDADGTSHFATCPNASKHRSPR